MMDAARVEQTLATLKDFQRRTVEHVFSRLYRDTPGARRYLVADEVGLGKTMVARGVIAKAIHHLQDKVDRVDVVYVCSNAAIARQNVARLNVLGQEQTTFTTRLTMLPMQTSALRQNKVNFVSFTPGTTFDLKSRAGTAQERAVLYRMLEGARGLRSIPLRNLLQANVRTLAGWERTIESCDPSTLDPELTEEFQRAVFSAPLREKLEESQAVFARHSEAYSEHAVHLRYEVIGGLRQVLASTCIDALEPDLIVLDEFQRFKDVLHGQDEAADLARQLFNYQDARVLLLSATPYRMYTLSHETEDDHHRDFLETIGFLADDDGTTLTQVRESLSAMRRAMLDTTANDVSKVVEARESIEHVLRRVMCRTERVARTRDRDAMLRERVLRAPVTASDVAQAVAVDRVSRVLGAGDAVEYWKSAPYLLNFMEGYELKQRLLEAKKAEDAVHDALSAYGPYLLKKADFHAYAKIDPENARLRALMAETIEQGNWRLLWLPPAVPYIAPSGPYAELGPSAASKGLVFSSWNVAPKAISVLLSYEAERRLLEDGGVQAHYDKLSGSLRPPLRFNTAGGRPTGMPALALLYPCATLAAHVDPLSVAIDLGHEACAPLADFRARIAARVKPLVEKLVARFAGSQEGAVDQRWYWAVPALLDAQHHSSVLDWLKDEDGFLALFRDEADANEENAHRAEDEDEDESGFTRHVRVLIQVLEGKETLARVPDDLAEVIADFALASPAVCAARAILRVSNASASWDPHVLQAAAEVAKGFRTLFNVPESIALLRGHEEDDEAMPYWRRVLEYCVHGNLQAVLDEYAHLLVENQGAMGKAPSEIADTVSKAMQSALSPRTANLTVDEVRVVNGQPALSPFRVRCRYALRFGEVRDEESGTVTRAETTRDAFNSPFRPFVLASTSVGQEGLDFHTYCHMVYHWNLPSNPVDLEQREGRVHRYKGHAVRRNIGLRYGLKALRERWDGQGDPWKRLFELAALDRPAGENELMPYWVFETEGGVSVERRIPLLPLSREVAQLERLKKQLALYRLAFGQPRQEDLLSYLGGRELPEGAADAWRVCLEPRALRREPKVVCLEPGPVEELSEV